MDPIIVPGTTNPSESLNDQSPSAPDYTPAVRPPADFVAETLLAQARRGIASVCKTNTESRSQWLQRAQLACVSRFQGKPAHQEQCRLASGEINMEMSDGVYTPRSCPSTP
jgi:hypothetical protein